MKGTKREWCGHLGSDSVIEGVKRSFCSFKAYLGVQGAKSDLKEQSAP